MISETHTVEIEKTVLSSVKVKKCRHVPQKKQNHFVTSVYPDVDVCFSFTLSEKDLTQMLYCLTLIVIHVLIFHYVHNRRLKRKIIHTFTIQ